MCPISEIDGGPAPVEPRAVVRQFEAVVQQHPEQLAVVCSHQQPELYGLGKPRTTDGEGLRWTYGTLHRVIQTITKHLSSHGLDTGTTFFLFCQSRIEYVLATLAAYYLGHTHVPINPESLSSLDDVQYMLDTARKAHANQRVIVLATADIARTIDGLDVPQDAVKIALDGDALGWILFEKLLEPIDGEAPITRDRGESILFTSGTTSRPKGCLISTDRWFSSLPEVMSLGRLEPGDVMATLLPGHHAFGHICTIMPLLRGSCVVIAASKFELRAAARAIVQERCTFLGLVGTMVHSLIEVLPSMEATSLKTIVFGGMVLSPALVQTCFDTFGLSSIENLYGMTEGVFSSTGPVSSVDSIKDGNSLSIGRPVPGLTMRVCNPHDRLPVPRATVGELHVSGYTAVQGYLSGQIDDFYNEDGRIWFITGDAAILDQAGRLFIIGRYKDTIIRGGENIAPARIEAVLAQTPTLEALQPQVVRKEDPFAGEVPVAVVKGQPSAEQIKLLQDTVRSALGTNHVPTAVIPMQTLGIKEHPRTSSGKISKGKLTELVAAYYHPTPSATAATSVDWQTSVTTAWAQILGLSPAQLELHTPLSHLADSILMLTARDRIRKDTGQVVPLDAWMETETLADQIALLRAQAGLVSSTNKPVSLAQGSPDVDDMVHLGGNAALFQSTKIAVQEAITPFGLCWQDVKEIFPCSDFIQIICKTMAVNTWNIRTTVVSHSVSVESMRNAIEAALVVNPVLLSFVVVNTGRLGPDLGLYVSLRQTRNVLDWCIEDYGIVNTLDEVRLLTMNYPYSDHIKLPGPLFRTLLVFVRETRSAAAITNISHAVLDKTSHQHFFEDVSRALNGETLSPHISYKEWADEYHLLRKSPSAENVIAFHVNYLRDLKEHYHVLWPHPTYQLVVTPERNDLDGHLLTFPAPALLHLCQTHSFLTPSVVIKSALALLVISRTNHSHAFFLSFEGARSKFPFAVGRRAADDVMDVAGPVFNAVGNLVAFQPKETVLDFLNRMQHDQNQLSQYATVPWREVLPRIGCTEEAFSLAAESLLYNWMPGLSALAAGGAPFENMRMMQVHIRAKLGMLMNAAMTQDGTGVVFFLQGSLANRSTLWTERFGEELKNICLWLAAEQSWSMQTGDFVHSIW